MVVLSQDRTLSATIRLKAQFYHLDPMAVVWHGNYVRFFEQARAELLEMLKHTYTEMSQTEYIWPVVDMRVKFLRPVVFAQEIDVTAWMKEYENRLKIEYFVTDCETGDILTKGFTIQAAVEKETGEMCLVSPSDFRERVAAMLGALDQIPAN